MSPTWVRLIKFDHLLLVLYMRFLCVFYLLSTPSGPIFMPAYGVGLPIFCKYIYFFNQRLINLTPANVSLIIHYHVYVINVTIAME